MGADVVRHDQVSEESGEVPQHVVFVPETFSPQLTEPAVQVGHAGGQGEQGDEEAFFFGCCFAQPGGDDGDEEVEADERVHEPQVAGQAGEVQQEARQVAGGRCAVNLSPQQGQRAVQQHEQDGGGTYAQEALAVELPHALSFLHGHQQVGGDNHEQGDGHARKAVVQGYPEAVCFVLQEGLGSGHFACPCRSVKILTGVYHHDQQAGEYAHIVQESNAFHVILSCFLGLNCYFI